MTNPVAPGGGSVPSDPGLGRRERSIALLVVVIALLTGILVGIVADRHLLVPRHRFAWHRGGPGAGGWGGPGAGRMGHEGFGHPDRGGGPPPEAMRRWLTRELGLTPAQATKMDSIMARRIREHRAMVDSMHAMWRRQLDSTRAEVDRVLTPEQRKKLDSLRAERDRRRARDGGGPGRYDPERGGPDGNDRPAPPGAEPGGGAAPAPAPPAG